MASEDRIVEDPNALVGKPCMRGTRLSVDSIVDLVAHGWSDDEITSNYPGLTSEDIHACLAYAAKGPMK